MSAWSDGRSAHWASSIRRSTGPADCIAPSSSSNAAPTQIGSRAPVSRLPRSARAGPPDSWRGSNQLLDDSEREQLLRLFAARLPELESLRLAHETMRQRGLADSRLAGEQCNARMAAADLGGLRQQACQLIAPADEGPIDAATLAAHGEILQPIHLGFFHAGPKAPPLRNSSMRLSSYPRRHGAPGPAALRDAARERSRARPCRPGPGCAADAPFRSADARFRRSSRVRRSADPPVPPAPC